MRFDWAAASDAGQVRAGNEDSAVAVEGLFAVADGMGGHAAGEVASRVAVEALQASFGEGIVAAVRSANQAVMERADADPSLRGMGTTLCAVAFVDGQLQVVNVGDSRAYLFRDGELVQITEDHNFVAQLEREGRLTAAEARVHPQRNIITRVLGNDPDVEVDVFPVDAFKGDRFLVCSDGLFSELVDDEIANVLRGRSPQDAADELVRQANAGGGRDNITVVVVDVLDDDDRSRTASAALAGAAATSVSQPVPPPTTDDGPRTLRPDDTITVEVPPRPRRVTWRSILFLVVLLAIVAAIVGSVWWFGRNTFYVGVDDDRVTIFRGRPGGVLWLDPTVEQRTGLDIGDVPAARRRDVVKGRDADSLADARRYVANLRDQAEEERAASTTTTTTSTSTTLPLGTATP